MRTPRDFKSVFDELAVSANQTPASVAASSALQMKLLNCFQRAYTRGYDLRSWEEAWEGAEVTPSNRLIDFAELGDARRFEVWSADPREPANCAAALPYTTTSAGILLKSSVTTAYVLWMPAAPKFTTTAYAAGTAYAVGARVLATNGHVYRCIQAGTGQEPSASAEYWTQVPVLAVLAEFVVEFASGTYLIEAGQPQVGAARRSDALLALETRAQMEFARTATHAWRPKA